MVTEPPGAVFSAGPFTWRRADVLAAATAGPEGARIERRLVHEVAALAMHDGPVHDEPVRTAIDALRRERGLLSRDDAEVWLADHGLDRADLVAWGERVAARRAVAVDEIEHHLARHPVPSDDIDSRRWATLVCSGGHRRWAGLLAQGAAAAETRGELAGRPDRPGPAELALARRSLAADAVSDDAALAALVARRRFEWITVAGTRLVFADPNAAAEAAHSLRDGRAVEEIRAHADDVQDRSVDVGSLDRRAQAAFAGAAPGEVLGPFASATDPGTHPRPDPVGAAVWVVAGRQEPSLDDPSTRARAAAEVAERALQTAMTRVVRWHVDP